MTVREFLEMSWGKCETIFLGIKLTAHDRRTVAQLFSVRLSQSRSASVVWSSTGLMVDHDSIGYGSWQSEMTLAVS